MIYGIIGLMGLELLSKINLLMKDSIERSCSISIIKMNFIDLLSLKCLPVINLALESPHCARVKTFYEEYKAY
jgi:hypothetical protein